MPWIIFKYAITAGLVVLISEAAKRSDKLGGLIAALPLVTVLTLIWLFMENQPSEKNRQSRLVHILVCRSNSTHVFGFSLATKTLQLLVNDGHFYHRHTD